MPTLHIRSAQLHHDGVCQDPENKVFIQGPMLASKSFAAQRATYCDSYCLAIFDLHGQGHSAKNPDRLDADSLTEDAVKSAESIAEATHRLRHQEALPRELQRATAASAKRHAIADELCRITALTLVVSGDEDRPIYPDRARAAHEGIAGSTFLPFARTGHAVMIERAAEFNQRFGAFVQHAGVAA
jgi:hypothetical protein